MAETLILTRADLRRSVDVGVLATELREAFVEYEEAGPASRVGTRVSAEVTAMVLVPGTAADVPAYTVKVNAKNPARRPALTGVICLHDLASGDLLAILDSGWLTALRTGVGAALGTDALARADARTVGIIGAGAQGRSQLRALSALREITSVLVHDIDPACAATFAAQMQDEVGIPTQVCADIGDLAAASELLMVATWSRTPVLTADQILPGTHITSLGADEAGKAELQPQLLTSSLVVTDDRRLAKPILPHTDTSLSRVLCGEHPGRQTDDQVTVYSPLGLPLQDCVAAWHAYCRALTLGLGTPIALED